MKIGLFTDTYFPQINGVGASVHTLAQSLSNLGHQVYIFTPKDPRQTQPEDDHIIRMPSMPCIFIRQYRMGLVYSPKELNKIAHLGLDIIHTQTEFSLGIFAKTLAHAFHLPVVHTYHTMYEDYVHYIVNGALISPAMAKEFSKLFCNSVNAVIAPTEKVAHFLRQYGVKKPIQIIPTGIDIQKFRKSNYTTKEIRSVKEELSIPVDCPVILSLGRIAKEKSMDVIINAMPELLKKKPDAMLVIVGDGPYREKLEDLTKDLGIEKSVLFTGFKPWNEIGKYYQLADVFVSASVTETQGLTFIEAMAAGLVVAAKKDECIADVLHDDQNGCLFEQDSELPEILYRLIQDPAKRKRLSENAVKSAESLSAETFGKSVLALYEDVLQNPQKYHFPSYSLSPIVLSRLAKQKIIRMNREINEETKILVNKGKRIFVRTAFLPALRKRRSLIHQLHQDKLTIKSMHKRGD